MTEWGAEQYIKMKMHDITCERLADKMGVERTYISKLFRKESLRDETMKRAEQAISDLIEEGV